MKLQTALILTLSTAITPTVFATDITMIVGGSSAVGDPAVFFGPPNIFCSSPQGNQIDEKYRYPSLDKEFSVPTESQFFLQYELNDLTVVYSFRARSDTVSFSSGYFYSDETLSDRKLGILSINNAPQFVIRGRDEMQYLEILSHSDLTKENYQNIKCPAVIRSFLTEYIDISIESIPSNAEIWLNGKKLDIRTNNIIRTPLKKDNVVLMVKKQGFIPTIRTIKESGDYNISLKKR